MAVKIRIIGCPKWEAVPPAHGFDSIVWTGVRAQRIIFHHTAGHHPEIENPQNESIAESVRYAQDIQRFHMGPERGWNDSGHNFLVCRNGIILQGRWRTIRAIQQRKMIVSAHCPGQNDQIGIEHEHVSGEKITTAQRNASAKLMAWIAGQYRLRKVLPVLPHSQFFPTACPDNLAAEIPTIKFIAQQILDTSV